MKKVIITIDTVNAAFSDEEDDGNTPGAEVARILRELAKKFDNGFIPQTVKDANGNTVGTCKIKG